MAALNLHHDIFTKGKDSNLPLHSATSFLHPVPETDESPTSQLFSSAAYQDLIQRQPTHPDGPTSGWDLGLSLLGDPITTAEHKSIEDHQTKMKLRRVHVINITFEFLFGIWGMYTTFRYFLEFADGLGDPERACALVLGIMSALAFALTIISMLMPLIPQQRHPRAWRSTRSLVRACYLLLLTAAALMNVVLVLIWHPSQFCDWDIDISWHRSATNTITYPCRTASFAAWITAATLRLVVTLTMVLSFIYTLSSYYGIRYPTSGGYSPKYSPYFPSDPEDISPVSALSPLRTKSAFKLTRSEESNYTFNQSNTTLPKSNSISTLAPSTSCTGHSRSQSTPPSKDMSLPKISPPTSRRSSANAANRGSSPSSSSSQFGSETLSQTQSINGVFTSSWVPHMLRRTSHISATQTAPDAVLSDISSHLEGFSGPTVTRDPSEIQSFAFWRPGHRSTGGHPDVRKTTLAWESAHVRHVSQTSQASVNPESLSSTHEDGESIKEKDKEDDFVYSYGYGASGPTYPYLDMYNPQTPGRPAETSSLCGDVDEHGFSQGHQQTIPDGPALPDVYSEPRSSLSREESSGEEEVYVAMMGGFVRRMATIESLGSKEAVGTLSTTTGSVALQNSMRSGAPTTSQFSSVRFADYGSSFRSGTSSLGVPPSLNSGTASTAYLSFSSGGTDMQVNERGELLAPGPNANRRAAGSSYDRHYFTASGSNLPKMDGEDR